LDNENRDTRSVSSLLNVDPFEGFILHETEVSRMKFD